MKQHKEQNDPQMSVLEYSIKYEWTSKYSVKRNIIPFLRFLYSDQELTQRAAANVDGSFLFFGYAMDFEGTNN